MLVRQGVRSLQIENFENRNIWVTEFVLFPLYTFQEN